jgi:hypothetical protein
MNGAIRFLSWMLALAMVTLPLVAVLNGWIASERWPIQRLRLTADYERVSAEQVRGAVAAQLGRGFFAVDLGEVRRAVAALPWVEQVEVRKRWPDLIEVSLRDAMKGLPWLAEGGRRGGHNAALRADRRPRHRHLQGAGVPRWSASYAPCIGWTGRTLHRSRSSASA